MPVTQHGRSYLEAGNYDAVILDIMMPKLDGLEALRRLRQQGNAIPVLLLTAKSEVADKVTGLDMGANDYLTKPFSTAELLARIRAMTRSQAGGQVTSRLTLGNSAIYCGVRWLLAMVPPWAAGLDGPLTVPWVGRYDKGSDGLRPVSFKLEATDEVSQIQYTPVR